RISWIIESVSLDICSVWFSRVKDSALLMDTGLLTAGELLAVAGLLTVGLLSGSGLISSVTTPIVDSASESPFSFGRRADNRAVQSSQVETCGFWRKTISNGRFPVVECT